MLLPVLGFVAMSYMRVSWVADHFVYIPMIGIVALVVATGAKIFQAFRPGWKPVLLTATAVTLGALAVLSYRYAEVWENEDKLWTYTLRHNWNSWQAHNRLGAREFNRGNVDVALGHFQMATRLRPDLAETQNNLGSAVLAKKDTKAAIGNFREALRLSPTIVAIQSNLANALVLDGHLEEARELYGDLAHRFPQNATFLCNWGVTLYRTGRHNEAIAAFQRALEINPDLADARENLRYASEALDREAD
jgi:tetratricopeptide (TPR) repeat protein